MRRFLPLLIVFLLFMGDSAHAFPSPSAVVNIPRSSAPTILVGGKAEALEALFGWLTHVPHPEPIPIPQPKVTPRAPSTQNLAPFTSDTDLTDILGTPTTRRSAPFTSDIDLTDILGTPTTRRSAPFTSKRITDLDPLLGTSTVHPLRLADLFRYSNKPVSPPPVDGFAVVPTDDATYSQTFHHNPSGKQLQAAIDVESKLRRESLTTDLQEIPQGIEDFGARLQRSPSSVYVIVGHNEAGYLIVPPKGEKLSLTSMAQKCEQAIKICVFLSCNSSKFVAQIGVERSLDFEDATALMTRLHELSKTAIQNKASEYTLLVNIKDMVRKQERLQNVKYKVTTIAPYATFGGIGLIVVTLATNNDVSHK
jgi:hypothetical protein